MKVENYYVKWQYHNKVVMDKKGKNHDCVRTECTIVTNLGNHHSHGNAVCSIKDTDEKEIGRKVSLTKAIKYFNKIERAKFWEVYRTMTKVPKWN